MIQTRRGKVLTRQTSWVKDDAKKDKMMMIFWLYVLTKLVINLTLQCISLNYQASIEQTKDPEVSSNLKERIRWIEGLMASIGQVHRADGATGIYFYAVFASNTLAFCVARFLFDGKIFDIFTENEFLLLLAKPDEDNEILMKRINSCIDRIICSNENFTKKIIDLVRMNKNSGFNLRNSSFEKEILFKQNTMFSNSQMNYKLKLSQFPVNKSIGNSSESKSANELGFSNDGQEEEELLIDFEKISAEVELIEALRKQRQFLIQSKSNIKKLLPAHRDTRMINELKRIGSLTCLFYGILSWLSGQLMATTIFYLAHSSLSTSSLDPKYRSFSLIDRIQGFEYHIIVYFGSFAFIHHTCISLVATFYKLKRLKSLWFKTHQFYQEVKRCESWHFREDLLSQAGGDFVLIKQSRKDLKFRCDKRLLELYLNYHIFRLEVQSTVKTAKTAASQIIVFVIFAVIPGLAYMEYIPRSHRSILVTIFIFGNMLGNLPFLLCAALDSACNKFAKHTWSILAFVEGHNHHLYSSSKSTPQANIFKRKNIDHLNKVHFSANILSDDDLDMLDYVYCSKSYITPHSVMLWHNLARNHKAVSEGFVSKIYGLFKINYSGVLRFNHWIVWIWLVTLTNQ